MDDREILLNLIKDINSDTDESYNTDECPICKSTNKIQCEKTANIICQDCGCVVDSLIDDTPEWRHYEDDGIETSRCSIPHNYLLPQSSLGTSIGGYGRSRIKILHKWNYMPYKERSFNDILKYIHKICVDGGIEKRIEDDAKILCKQVIQGIYVDEDTNEEKSKIIRGNHRNGIIAASVFFACRRNGKSRSPHEIAKLAGVCDTDVTTGCKHFEDMANKLPNVTINNLDLGSSNAEQFVIRYCLDLKIGKEFTERAARMARNVKLLKIASEHSPISIATACIILQAKLDDVNISKKKIREIVDISEVTINKILKKLETKTKIITNDNNTKKIIEALEKIKKSNIIPSLKHEKINSRDIDRDFKLLNDKVNKTLTDLNTIQIHFKEIYINEVMHDI